MTWNLNNTVASRESESQNMLNVRRVDVQSLADSTPVQNYFVASAGEMELIQQQNQK